MAFSDIYKNRRVLVTGHTGFKGSWLCEWLLSLGANVSGIALAPQGPSSLFTQIDLASRMDSREHDIRDAQGLTRLVKELEPEIVFHLAAQPLVRTSYERPLETYEANVMGTANLLEAVRQAGRPSTVVAITTDKCYENREWVYSYREEDPMGGYDPYSSSKGAAELVISAYRRSYFSKPESQIRLASARAGNVIGGGDWALDRIVPDIVRALQEGRAIGVRNPRSTRPWQHVLEPLSGYLWLAARLDSRRTGADADTARELFPRADLASAFNFGPRLDSNRDVAALVEESLKIWPGSWRDESDPAAVHEAHLLNLSTDKAHHYLQWEPVWDFRETVTQTMTWYRAAFETPGSEQSLTQQQIAEYQHNAKAKNLRWIQ